MRFESRKDLNFIFYFGNCNKPFPFYHFSFSPDFYLKIPGNQLPINAASKDFELSVSIISLY